MSFPSTQAIEKIIALAKELGIPQSAISYASNHTVSIQGLIDPKLANDFLNGATYILQNDGSFD